MTQAPRPVGELVGVKSSILNKINCCQVYVLPAEGGRILKFFALSVLLHVLGLGLLYRSPTMLAEASNVEGRLSVVLRSAGSAEMLNPSADRAEVLHDLASTHSQAGERAVASLEAASGKLVATQRPVSDERVDKISRGQLGQSSHLSASEPSLVSASRDQSQYRAIGLDPPPRPLHDIEPDYPVQGGVREGSVVLRLSISEKGIVDEAIVVRSFPPGVFDSSAVLAFSSAKFSPGMFLGFPVKSQLTVEVEFMPLNRGASVAGRSY